MPRVSLVIPVYNERENLPLLLDRIAVALNERDYEIVAVDDGSTDGSTAVLRSRTIVEPRLRVLRLACNAGQSAALVAGFRAARGDVVVTMDADLQNDPADVPRLLDVLNGTSGRNPVDAVVGYRLDRQDSRWKRFQGWIANAIRNWLNNETIRDTGCSLKAIRRDKLLDLPVFDGMHRFLPTLVRMHGGRVVEVGVQHRKRCYGRTQYGMWNRVFHALADALAVRWMQRRAVRYDIAETIER